MAYTLIVNLGLINLNINIPSLIAIYIGFLVKALLEIYALDTKYNLSVKKYVKVKLLINVFETTIIFIFISSMLEISKIIGYLFSNIFVFFILRNELKSKFNTKINSDLISIIFKLGGLMCIFTISNFVLINLDKIYLNIVFNEEILGLFTVMMFIPITVKYLCSGLSQTVQLIQYKNILNVNTKYVYVIIVSFVFILFSLTLPIYYEYIIKNKENYDISFVKLALAYKYLNILCFYQVTEYIKNGRFNFIIISSLISVLISIITFLIFYDLKGVFYANLLSFIILLILLNTSSNKNYNLVQNHYY